MMNPAELANGAYNAYGASVSFKNHQGNPMPGYGDLPLEIQRAWQEAVNFVVQQCEHKDDDVPHAYESQEYMVDDNTSLQALEEPFVPVGDPYSSKASRFREMTGESQTTE